MLARLAEDLYWAGRYLERVQHTARVLDVTTESVFTSPTVDQREIWERALSTLVLESAFRERFDTIDNATVSGFCVIDTDNPGSLASLIRALRENVPARTRARVVGAVGVGERPVPAVLRHRPAAQPRGPSRAALHLREGRRALGGRRRGRDDGARRGGALLRARHAHGAGRHHHPGTRHPGRRARRAEQDRSSRAGRRCCGSARRGDVRPHRTVGRGGGADRRPPHVLPASSRAACASRW